MVFGIGDAPAAVSSRNDYRYDVWYQAQIMEVIRINPREESEDKLLTSIAVCYLLYDRIHNEYLSHGDAVVLTKKRGTKLYRLLSAITGKIITPDNLKSKTFDTDFLVGRIISLKFRQDGSHRQIFGYEYRGKDKYCVVDTTKYSTPKWVDRSRWVESSQEEFDGDVLDLLSSDKHTTLVSVPVSIPEGIHESSTDTTHTTVDVVSVDGIDIDLSTFTFEQ